MKLIAVLARNTDVLPVLEDALGNNGWEVRPYSDLQALSTSLHFRRPDLILLEASPREGEAGWETLAALQREYDTASLPVIVTSDNFLDLQNHLEDLQDVAAVLVRPCTRADVLRCVTAAQNWNALQDRGSQETVSRLR
jgi:CheY-like chemotaxis protein